VNCQETRNLMDGYLDGELDPLTNQAIEGHLESCPNCNEAYAMHGALIRSVERTAPYYRATPELRQQIQSSLRQEVAQSPVDVAPSLTESLHSPARSQSRPAFFWTEWNWLALAAAIILAAVIGFLLLPGRQRASTGQLLATELIASHVRSLMANHLTDVASSDQHTVKPWLDTKLDFAPAVVDLSNEGFPLVGGRLDYLDNRPVAALVYQRRKHFINLFIWPVESGTTGTTKDISRQGYQLVHWVDSDFNYWAVSDVSDMDLQTFKQVFEKQLSHH
jgi:anti-sigma factor RsiW